MRHIRRALIAAGVVVVILGGLFIGARALWNSISTQASNGCTFSTYTTETGQAAIGSTMASVVTQRKLPERAILLVLMAGLQESKLRNLASGQGDRDSVGVLQQRPSQGWGTVAELSDVPTATGKFLDRLVQNANWQTADPATAIQEVQNSVDGSLYDQHADQAQVMADVFAGKVARGVSCRFATPTQVAAPTAVAAALSAELPVATPTVSGRTITVNGAAWTTVSWLITHADAYGIDSVAYAGGRWDRTKGWRDDTAASAGAVSATMHAAS